MGSDHSSIYGLTIRNDYSLDHNRLLEEKAIMLNVEEMIQNEWDECFKEMEDEEYISAVSFTFVGFIRGLNQIGFITDEESRKYMEDFFHAVMLRIRPEWSELTLSEMIKLATEEHVKQKEDKKNMKNHVKRTIEEIMETQLAVEQYKLRPDDPHGVEFIDGFLRGLRFSKLITNEEYQRYFTQFTDKVKEMKQAEENGGNEE